MTRTLVIGRLLSVFDRALYETSQGSQNRMRVTFLYLPRQLTTNDQKESLHGNWARGLPEHLPPLEQNYRQRRIFTGIGAPFPGKKGF